MICSDFMPGLILRTALRYTLQNQRYLCDHYLHCDRTLVYKWMNDKIILPRKHIPLIVRFVSEQTRPLERAQIREDIEAALLSCALGEESKAALARVENFDEFLSFALLRAIAFRQAEPSVERREEDVSRLKPNAGISARFVLCGFLASTVGGVLWAVLNQLFAWPYYMGGSGNEPRGPISAVWGMLTSAPVILCALTSVSREAAAPLAIRKKTYLIMAYTLLGGVGAFAFYNSGYRSFIERLGLAYGLREFVIAVGYALALSAFPLAAFATLPRRFRMPAWFLPGGILICSAAVAMIALGTGLIGRPEAEIAQLRGFAVAIVLRLCMFTVAHLFLSDRLRLRDRLNPVSTQPGRTANRAV